MSEVNIYICGSGEGTAQLFIPTREGNNVTMIQSGETWGTRPIEGYSFSHVVKWKDLEMAVNALIELDIAKVIK